MSTKEISTKLNPSYINARWIHESVDPSLERRAFSSNNFNFLSLVITQMYFSPSESLKFKKKFEKHTK